MLPPLRAAFCGRRGFSLKLVLYQNKSGRQALKKDLLPASFAPFTTTRGCFYLPTQTSLDKGTQRKTTENELPSLTQCTAYTCNSKCTDEHGFVLRWILYSYKAFSQTSFRRECHCLHYCNDPNNSSRFLAKSKGRDPLSQVVRKASRGGAD